MSGLKFLLDTNIVIGLLKGNPSAVSQITRMELLGFRGVSDAEESRIRQFLQACHVLLIDEKVEDETIRLRKLTSLKLPDSIIAATARVNKIRLLTLDEKLASQFGVS